MMEWTGWPPRSVFSLWFADDCQETVGDEGDPDLSDLIMLHWFEPSRTVELSLATSSRQWAAQTWDEPTIARMEANIRHDIEADGDQVAITRLTGQGGPCTSDMTWRLVVTQQ